MKNTTYCQVYEDRSLHFDQRINQRGISLEMVETTLKYGEEIRKERYFLGRKNSDRLIAGMQSYLRCGKMNALYASSTEEIEQEIRTLKKIRDKGGVTVVYCDGQYITAWNRTSRMYL